MDSLNPPALPLAASARLSYAILAMAPSAIDLGAAGPVLGGDGAQRRTRLDTFSTSVTPDSG